MCNSVTTDKLSLRTAELNQALGFDIFTRMNPFKMCAYQINTGREKLFCGFSVIKEGIDCRLFILLFA